MAQLTAFGREVRKLRIDRTETLRQMADALQVSPAFLSAVETGSKPLPEGFLERVIKHFKSSNEQRTILENAANMSQKKVQIDLGAATDGTRALALAFARRLPSMSKTQQQALMDILSKD